MKAALILAAVLLLVVVASTSNLARRDAKVDDVALGAANAIPPVDIPASLVQAGEAGAEVKLVLLALLPEGFDSTEIQLEPGDYLFIIGNRTGLKEVDVRLEREGKERVAAAMVGGRRRDWKQRLKLTPGTYLVTAADNPDWTCRIVVGR
jgi:hypothetical protein